MWKDPNCIRWSCTVCRTFWRWLDSSELNYVRFVSHCVRYVALLVRFVAVFEDDWIRQSLFSKFSKSNSLEFNKILWINFGKIPVTSGRFSIWPAGTGSENFDRKFRSDRKWPEFRSVTSQDGNYSSVAMRRFAERYETVRDMNVQLKITGWDDPVYRAGKITLCLKTKRWLLGMGNRLRFSP